MFYKFTHLTYRVIHSGQSFDLNMAAPGLELQDDI